MISLISTLMVIAMIDSTSMVPIGLVPLAAILSAKRPAIGAVCFIAGILVVYFLAGLLLLFGFDLVFDAIGPSIARWWNEPNTMELVLQLVISIALLIYAPKQYRLPNFSALKDI